MSDPANPLAWMNNHKVAELITEGKKASTLMEECTDVKTQEGAVSLKGIFLGVLPRGDGVVAEGKKAAPDKYRIKLVGVKEFVARYRRDQAAADAEIEGEEGAPVQYITIVDDSTFSLKAYQSVPKDKAVATLSSGGDPMSKKDIDILLEQAKKDARKNIYVYRGEFVISEGGTIITACFNPRAAKLTPGTLVEVMGTSANAYWASKGEQGWRMGVNTQSIIVSPDNHPSVVDNLKAYDLLDKVNLPIYDANEHSTESFIVLFDTTVDKPDFTKAGKFSRLENSKEAERYFYKNKSEKEMMKLQLTMFSHIWDERGFEEGWNQTYTTTVFQWSKDKKSDDRLVLKFGMPDVADWKKFMSVNRVPVITISTIDYDETAKLPDPKGGLVLQTWEYFPMLREYLLRFCPRISWEYMLSKLGSKRTAGRIERNDPNKPNFMNNEAGERQGADWIMTGDVIALSSWEGYSDDVIKAGCEVRALLDVDMDLGDRIKFGNMSIEDAMKVIKCEPDAPIRLDKTPTLYYYAVKPLPQTQAHAHASRVIPMDVDEDEVPDEAPAKRKYEGAATKSKSESKKAKTREPDEQEEQGEVREEEEEEETSTSSKRKNEAKGEAKKKARIIAKGKKQ